MDLHSYARMLNSLSIHNYARQGKQLHLLFLKTGVLFSTLSIANRLLLMYARCGRTDYAQNLFDEMPHRNCFTWNSLLEGHVKSGNKVDSLNFFYSMPHRNEFSWNVMLTGLVRGGDLGVARRLFNDMPMKNVVAWNTMIHGYARNGESTMALALFKDFLSWEIIESSGVLKWDPFILATAIGACSDLGNIELGKQIHARMIIDRVEFDSVLGSSLINMYGKCGDLDSASFLLTAMGDLDDYSLSSLISCYANSCRMNDARRIFELKSNPCTALWSSIIAGYVANDDPVEALKLFNSMQKQGIVGDYSTFSSVLSACSIICILKNCLQLHTCACKVGIVHDLVVASALIDAYAKCGSPINACYLFDELKTYDTVLLNSMISIYCNCGKIDEAKRIFYNMGSKSLISWNSMIVGLSQNGYPTEALELFCLMNTNGLRMDNFTLSGALSACSSISLLEFGEQIFAKATVIGVDFDQVVATSIIDFYCKGGFVELGREVFNRMVKLDEVSWNSMLMGYAANGYGAEALALFEEMRNEGVTPTKITFTAVLCACDHRGLVEEGKKWFYRMKHEYCIAPEIEHYSCMIDLLARAGYLEEAIDLIDGSHHHSDVNMWSAILRGCVENGDKALSKNVAGRIIRLNPQNSGALIQLSGLLASTGDWGESAMVRQLMRELRIQKNPGRSWCTL